MNGVPKHTRPIVRRRVVDRTGCVVTRPSGNENPFVQKASKKHHTKC